MKKVRITLKDSKKIWSFPIYESLTSFMYLHGKKVKSDKFKQVITLSKGEFLEIEWIGADYYQVDVIGMLLKHTNPLEDLKLSVCHNVRIGKSTRKSGRKGFDFVVGYAGWVSGDTIPWNNGDCPGNLKVIELKGRHKPKIDFNQLFQDTDVNLLPNLDSTNLGIASC